MMDFENCIWIYEGSIVLLNGFEDCMINLFVLVDMVV